MVVLSDSERLRLAKEALLGRLVPDLLHQLRNPLNAILTSAELIHDKRDDVALRETLVPVLLRSAHRMRDLLSAMDYRRNPDGDPAFELRTSLSGVLSVLSSRQHSLSVHRDAEGLPLMLAGDGAALWTLLLFVLEGSLGAAKNDMWIRITETAEHVELTLAHDGESHTSPKNSSGLEQDVIDGLAREIGAQICYAVEDPGRLLTVVTLRKETLPNPSVEK